MAEEIVELKEHADEGAHNPSLRPVSLTMAILAVLVATVSLLGHRAHTEELLLQNKATDNWSYYQAKSIRRHSYELFLDLLSVSDPKDAKAAGDLKEKYQREIGRYDREEKQIEEEGHKLEQETAFQGKKADRFDLGEVLLEIALVVTSITLLTGRTLYWKAGILSGCLGLAVAVTAFWIS
jgi:uncharacterized protein DUF4337